VSGRRLYGGVSEVGKAAGHRLADAAALLGAGRWRGAMYLAGYAVECRLKAKLMKQYGCDNLYDLGAELERRGKLAVAGDVYTHALESLVLLTGRLPALRANRGLWRQFAVVNRWLPAWRYTADPGSRDAAADFVEAADDLVRWIEHNV
jgi:HEPN domain-containing protein